MTATVDLIVVGGGAGGLTAAREGARRGAHTVLVQDGAPGGDCTFTGCVPSKTLLSAGERGATFADAMTTVRSTVERIAATEDTDALRAEGIEVHDGRGAFVDPRTIDVDGRRLRSPRIVVATGSRPATPPVEGLRDVGALTNETVFDLTERPGRLSILGGGPIGVEMAEAFTRLGTRVTILEREGRLLPRDDAEASEVIRSVLERRGVDVRTDASVVGVSRRGGSGPTLIELDDGDTIEADRLLVATGRVPSTAGLDPERAGIELDDSGAVRVDDTMATTADGVWAVGDVAGRLQLTHAAGRMAMVATANAFRGRLARRRRVDESSIPRVTYADPEVAQVGMTEADAVAHGARVAWLPLDEVDRALTSDRTDGFVKLVAGPRRLLGNVGGGRLLGATIVAPRAGEMIHEVALAMRTDMFTGRLAQTVHAYPSWSMAIQEAAAQFFVEHRGRVARPARAAGIR